MGWQYFPCVPALNSHQDYVKVCLLMILRYNHLPVLETFEHTFAQSVSKHRGQSSSCLNFCETRIFLS